MTVQPSKGSLISYFAYGSNLDTAQMARRCPDSQFRSTATLDGYRFIIVRRPKNRGVASIIQDAASSVKGVLWSLTPVDEMSLDRHEGVSKHCYEKQNLNVTLTGGENVLALTYIATDNTPGLPKPGYLENIIQNAERLRFDTPYVTYLKTLFRP